MIVALNNLYIGSKKLGIGFAIELNQTKKLLGNLIHCLL